jgi:uncharacterized ion transporter superfamily protein YfcC
VIPWGDFSASLESITLGWYFPELAALFLVGAVLVGLVGVLGEEGPVRVRLDEPVHPTSAVVMGGLALSRARYDRYLRFVAPLLGILLVLTCLAMLLGVAVPALGVR